MRLLGLRVLVVDDDQSTRGLLRSLLVLQGCKVEVAVNGQEAVEKYGQFRPDLVLMDLDMPSMNGFNASREIMKLDPQAAVLLVTGLPYSTLARRAIEKRLVKVVIPKPFQFAQLEMAIQEATTNPKPTSTTLSEKGGIA